MGEHNCYKHDVAECIKKKAYELWEKDGRKPDRDLHYWLDAEKAVKVQAKKQSPMSQKEYLAIEEAQQKRSLYKDRNCSKLTRG